MRKVFCKGDSNLTYRAGAANYNTKAGYYQKINSTPTISYSAEINLFYSVPSESSANLHVAFCYSFKKNHL